MRDLLTDASTRAVRYVSGIGNRRIAPRQEDIARLSSLGGPMPEEPCDPRTVLALLDDIGSPATVASTGGRYFGFVTGATLPAALAANWIAGVWDQNAGMRVMSPVGAALEDITLGWLREALGLPPSTGVGFVTGATMANFTCLAAARHALLERAGWNVEDNGLFSAPPLTVVVSDEVHVSVLKALSMLGLGRTRVTRLATDDQGRIKSDSLPAFDDRTIVCIQAGNVNTGAFDPAAQICSYARGLWDAKRHLAPVRQRLPKRLLETVPIQKKMQFRLSAGGIRIDWS